MKMEERMHLLENALAANLQSRGNAQGTMHGVFGRVGG